MPREKIKEKFKKLFLPLFLFTVLFLGIIMGLSFTISLPAASPKQKGISQALGGQLQTKVARAAEIYPEFVCTCCGQKLNPAKICCGTAKKMIDYIDAQTASGLTKDEVMVKAIKEFGFEALADKNKQAEFKAKLAAAAPIDAPKIIFSQTSHDFGQISQQQGVVSTLFNFKNEGGSDLVIDKLSTSCGCTSAAIVYKGKEGPTFTMPGHGKANPTGWQVAIAPGETAQLKIYYDPNAHGKQAEAILPTTRTASIFSNDPVNFEVKLKIELNQTP